MGEVGEDIMRHFKKRKKQYPPDTKRFCYSCQKKTVFSYNKILGHSECTKCGWRDIKI